MEITLNFKNEPTNNQRLTVQDLKNGDFFLVKNKSNDQWCLTTLYQIWDNIVMYWNIEDPTGDIKKLSYNIDDRIWKSYDFMKLNGLSFSKKIEFKENK